ncbi:BatA domain-containing protein [Lutibacter sp.]|uniref:BatA domain-containing protein n=1 Tax=Lutibacter sp. TaxID=1925666 RepID=UPI0025C082B7|nr:BatA domain-containing protein [Lutibacter sp.]MCF6167858.1 BatA domain-containing protein [Lutibacter sp.]
MHFKHPEILYALLLLIIPIIVHLFQLQRFVKVPFTNVQFLKNIEQQTRKSTRLKKWVILITRLLVLTSLIIAFAQPYFSNLSSQLKFNTTVYLDNSFSMQAKGNEGELLRSISQKIIKENINTNNTISLITNDAIFKNLTIKSLKSKLISLKYSSNKLDLSTVLLKIKTLNKYRIKNSNKVLLLSDFQSINYNKKSTFTNVNSPVSLLKLNPIKNINIFIDSIYITKNNLKEITIKVEIKSTSNNTSAVPISLYNNAKLIGKTTAKFRNSTVSAVEFTIPNSVNFNGKISLVDTSLEFDNDFYFTISKPEKISVLSIGNSSEFLSKIYTKTEFNFTHVQLHKLNYNNIQKQQLIILNEIDVIPSELIQDLHNFSINGGTLVIIPSKNSNLNSYNRIFKVLDLGLITKKNENEYKITTINYEHPLIKDVFERKVANFQYPKTITYYKTNLKNSSSVLKLANNDSFISSKKNKKGVIYWVSSPLNSGISNFLQSPLIVPVFYNFAKKNLKINQLYYTIAPENNIDIKTTVGKDDILKISTKTQEFIPLQTISQNKVTLKIQGAHLQSGFYQIKSNNTLLKTVAFNYNREESDLTYLNLKKLTINNKNITIIKSIDDFFNEINNQKQINWLFKLFLAFSMLFLLIEMLILKYFNK